MDWGKMDERKHGKRRKLRGLGRFSEQKGCGCREEGAHLGDGDFVELQQALGRGQALADEDGVEAFEIGEDDELLDGGVVADVALGIGMGVAPLPGGSDEESNVEVGFAGVDRGRLRRLALLTAARFSIAALLPRWRWFG